MDNTRRDFIKKVGIGSAALTVGGIAPGFSAKSYSRIQGANDRVRLAVVGLHIRGEQLAGFAARQKNAEVIYVCDVDEREMPRGIAAVTRAGQPAPKAEKDFRVTLKDKALDAIIIATPDHWHTPATILGLQAGKHVYVEKPLSHNPKEGELAIQAALKYKRVVQMGNQRRSSPEVIQGIQELKNGAIGRVYFAKGWYTNKRRSIGIGKPAAVPSWLDYELWQGPAPRRAYKDNLIHYNWHWFWHWGTGESLNNGTHEMDIARWGLGVEYPIRVSSLGGMYHYQDDWETPDTQVITCDYPGKISAMWECRSRNGKNVEGLGGGIIFYGEKGALEVRGIGGFRNDYLIYDENSKTIKHVKTGEAEAQKAKGPVDDGDTASMAHMANFLDSIRGIKTPNSDAATGYKSTLLMHLGNISWRVGRTLNIDSKTGKIIGDPEAQKLWGREYEKGWEPVI